MKYFFASETKKYPGLEIPIKTSPASLKVEEINNDLQPLVYSNSILMKHEGEISENI